MLQTQALLAELGARLREARHQLGWSVTELARRSRLSRRYVTETEAGRANPSILKLAQLAQALRIPLGELCDLPIAGAPTERVALVGLRGAGKTSVGRRLALALEVPFIELDERIEELSGLSVSEIFDLRGESAFRELEREALERVLASSQRSVIATGGGIVRAADTFARLRESCRTVWLTASPAEHLQRVVEQGDRRPMAGRPRALDELRGILAEREERYELCQLKIDTSGKPLDDVVQEALGVLEGTPPAR